MLLSAKKTIRRVGVGVGGYNTALQWGRCLLSSLYSLSSLLLPVNFKAICQSLIQHSSISLAADIGKGKGGVGGAAGTRGWGGEGRGGEGDGLDLKYRSRQRIHTLKLDAVHLHGRGGTL